MATALSRVFTRSSRIAATLFLSPQHQLNCSSSLLSRHRFHSLSDVSAASSALHHYGLPSMFTFSRRGMCTSTSSEKDQGADKSANENADAATDAKNSHGTQQTGDMDELSRDDLIKLVLEKEQTLEQNQKEFSDWKDKFLRSYAEVENLMERTRRDAENSKKFAAQSFAKSLLDVADNLGRASSVTRESFNKLDASSDSVGAVPLLKTLLEGVEMTEKQLSEAFRKSGIEKYDPTNEQFDPNKHNAVFQVPDNSKPPGTVAVVLKAGYMLHERIIRPAEVGVTVSTENNEANS